MRQNLIFWVHEGTVNQKFKNHYIGYIAARPGQTFFNCVVEVNCA